MAESQNLRNYFRPQDGRLLDEAKGIRENLCYVVAALGQGTRTWEEIDQELQNAKVLGYMGMTVPTDHSRDSFLAGREVMALVVAVRIDGPKFKKINYEYHTDSELKLMGFEPYVENPNR